MNAPRLNAYETAPAAMNALRAVEAYLHQSELGAQLIELVKMRASQINGCASINLWNRLAISLRTAHPVDAAA